MEFMNRVLWPFVISFLIVIVLMPFIIRYFREKQLGQVTREVGPSWHNEKSGTPTMGGVAFILSTVLTALAAFLLNIENSINLWLLVGVLVLYGLIGLVDDFIILIKKQNEGLTSGQKFTAQIVIGVLFYLVLLAQGFDNTINIGFIQEIPLSYFYGIFAVFWMVGFSNATNLTDGIDGLLATTGSIAYAAYAYIAYTQEQWGVLVFAISVVGGLLGFFIFNKKPAQIFMGDVGSLALGAGLAAMSILLKVEWTILLIGIIFVIETASVMLQVASFKTRGKRIFKMSPIHHHFEIEGWSEWKIVGIFSLITLLGSLLAIAFV